MFRLISAVPLIAQRPADTHVSAGSNAVFECGVRGNPRPTIFWSLQDNDTVLFPEESWNEFHAEDTKDSVSTLVVHVSLSTFMIGTYMQFGRAHRSPRRSYPDDFRLSGNARFSVKYFFTIIVIITGIYTLVAECQERTARSAGGHVFSNQRGGLGRMASHFDSGGGGVRRVLTADHRIRTRQPDAAVQFDW